VNLKVRYKYYLFDIHCIIMLYNCSFVTYNIFAHLQLTRDENPSLKCTAKKFKRNHIKYGTINLKLN